MTSSAPTMKSSVSSLLELPTDPVAVALAAHLDRREASARRAKYLRSLEADGILAGAGAGDAVELQNLQSLH
jgi:hypothetical protein